MTAFNQLLSSLRRSWPLAAACGILSAVLAWQLFSALVWQPLSQRQTKLHDLQKKARDLQLVVAQGEKAERYCQMARTKSVSADPAVVAHRYQQWLLTRTAKLGQILVTAGHPIAEGATGFRVGFTVEGECGLADLAALVEEISQTPLLHRITYLAVEPQQQGKENSKGIQFSLNLEALALADATSLEEIPEPEFSASAKKLQSFLVAKKPFERGYLGPPPAQNITKSPTTPTGTLDRVKRERVDPLRFIKLVGSVGVGDLPQAWIVDSRTKQEWALSVGKSLQFLMFQGTIKHVDRDYVELEVAKAIVRWEMGQDIRSALDRAQVPDEGMDVAK